jgi:hypothetical protein
VVTVREDPGERESEIVHTLTEELGAGTASGRSTYTTYTQSIPSSWASSHAACTVASRSWPIHCLPTPDLRMDVIPRREVP